MSTRPADLLEISVHAHAVHVPGANTWETGGGAVEGEPMCSADEAHMVLGRKGLLAKEPSTRLALCAVHRAFGLPPGKLEAPLPLAERTAVVVSSNLGNLQTVCALAAGVRVEGFRAVSPLEAPNASSNIVASTIAIRYGFTGPNIMLCNGATSGLDAVRYGARLIRAGRADRAVVVGVEPDDEISQALAKSRDPQTYGDRGAPALRAAAACVVLGPADGARATGPAADQFPARPEAILSASGVVAPGARPPAGHGDLRFLPYGTAADSELTVDLTARLGETYGALGVLQAAAAAARIAGGDATEVHAACGDAVEGYAWLTLRAGAVVA